MPRKRHVSRNCRHCGSSYHVIVMPRKRHVSRNVKEVDRMTIIAGHASQEACE